MTRAKKTRMLTRSTACIGLISAVALLAGCASGPRQAAASIDHVSAPDHEHGVVIGKVCYGQGIRIGDPVKNVEVMHIGGDTAFALRLAPGRYQIKEISSGIGPYFPAGEPLAFEVAPDRTTYIGTIKASWQYGTKYALECETEGHRFVARRDYKRGGIGRSESAPVWVIDDLPNALPGLKRRYPNFKFDQIVSKPSR